MADTKLVRRAAVRHLLADADELLVIAGLGASAWDVAACGDRRSYFYLWNAMGNAAAVGFGLALAQPNRLVAVITGDGEQLMGLAALATIGAARPRNLHLVVLDNERYGETGKQATATAHGCDLAAIASACGFARTHTVRKQAALDEVAAGLRRYDGPSCSVLKVGLEDDPSVLPPKLGAGQKHRFRGALALE
jgi:thiamine pyrophosphate-dependent acetolactate synthase large subunit-like protein